MLPVRWFSTLLLWLCFSLPISAASQSLTPLTQAASGVSVTRDLMDYGRPNIRVFTDKEGLPQNAITSLVFDQEGYLWAGTKDGVARYDGRSWTVVNLPKELKTNWIHCLMAASDGSLWVGTHEGLAQLDRGRWRCFTKTDGLPDNEIRCLKEISNGQGGWNLWVGTWRGLARWTGQQWQTEPPFPSNSSPEISSLLERKSPDGHQEIWVGCPKSGIARWREGVWTVYDQYHGLPSEGVTCLLETTALDGQRRLVAGTFTSDLMVFNESHWTSLAGTPLSLGGGGAHCLLETQSPTGEPVLWAGNAGGLKCLVEKRWLSWRERQGMSGLLIWCLAQAPGPNGTVSLWAGTAGEGIIHWQLGTWMRFDKTSGLPENSTYSLLVTQDEAGADVVWLGSNTKGFSRLNPDGTWTYFNEANWVLDAGIRSFCETRDPDGRSELWVGTDHLKLCRFKNGQWTVFSILGENQSLLVWCIVPTRASDGTPALWLGTEEGLFYLPNEATVPTKPAWKLPDKNVLAILETASPQGTILWLGTRQGLVRIAQGQITDIFDARSGLPGNQVLSLREYRTLTGERSLWVGTNLGVARLALDSPTPKWSYLSATSTPALPNNTIYRIEEDARHRLYLCTNKGVARLTPRTPTPDDVSEFEIYTYTTDDGLPSNECNTGASTVDHRGRIWVGTIAGVAVLDPAREVTNRIQRPLLIQQAVLPDQGRVLRDGDVLAYDENHIQFEFALLSFFREGEIRYRTQIEGLDPHPSAWTKDFSRDYISLPPGRYRFQVWGRDVFGNVSGPVGMSFTIRRAPWLTWWAVVGYTLTLGFGGYGIFRYRLRTLRHRNELLQAKIAERTSQLAQTVEELRDSEHRALEANRAKSVFLANMSHELRTPLNAILGFVQLMDRDASLPVLHRESLGIISRSGQHLLGLINDVLSIAKIEAGKITLVETTFDLSQLLRSVRDMIRIRAEAKELIVNFVLDPNLPTVVLGDEGKLRQVLVNLLGNAVKFTSQGSVTLTATWKSRGDQSGQLQFEIRDTGCGISESDCARLFEAFVQTESGRKMQEGTGLGLVISRDFVRLMGGDIRVSSILGQGTTFHFDVVLQVATQVEAKDVHREVIGLAPNQPGWRILVVDDTEENRLLLTRLLQSVGFQVRESSDGAEAVALAGSWKPDLIWMDMRMPVMDGLEATRHIRAQNSGENHSGKPVIIALTASAFDHEQERFLRAGCDDYVPKPFEVPVIFEKMARYLGVKYVYEESELPVSGSTGSVLTSDRLRNFSPDAIQSLTTALMAGDTELAIALIENVRQQDASLADELAGLVRSYRFDEILDWLEGREG